MTHSFQHPRPPFTLIELLTTISIIALLMTLLLPVLKHAREKAWQSYCANNLREISRANLMYHDDYGRLVAVAEDIAGANLIRWHGHRPVNSYHSNFDYSRSAIVTYLGDSARPKRCPVLERLVDFDLPAYEKGGGGYGYNPCLGSRVYVTATANHWSSVEANASALGLKEVARPDSTVMFADAACFVDNAGNYRASAATARLAENSFAWSPHFVKDRQEDKFSEPSPTIHFRHLRTTNVAWADGHLSAETMRFSDASDWGQYGLGWFGPEDNSLFDPF